MGDKASFPWARHLPNRLGGRQLKRCGCAARGDSSFDSLNKTVEGVTEALVPPAFKISFFMSANAAIPAWHRSPVFANLGLWPLNLPKHPNQIEWLSAL